MTHFFSEIIRLAITLSDFYWTKNDEGGTQFLTNKTKNDFSKNMNS